MLAAALSGVDSYAEDGTPITGLEAVKRERELHSELSGELTVEVISEAFGRLRQISGNPEYRDSQGVILREVSANQLHPISDIITNAFTLYAPAGVSFDYSAIDRMSYEDGQYFYENRTKKLAEHLDTNQAGLTDAEKQFIMNMNDKVKTPFVYSYKHGWMNLMMQSAMTFVALGIIMSVCVSSVFSNEFQTGAASIILSSVNGRKKVFTAKITAAAVFATAFFILTAALLAVVFLTVFGAEGHNASFQNTGLMSVYNLTHLQAYLLVAGLAFLGYMSCFAVTILISSAVKSNFAVIAVSLLVLLAPMFIPEVQNQSTLTYLLDLFPIKMLESYSTLRACFKLYPFGDTFITQPAAMLLAAGFICAVCLTAARIVYSKQQVTS
jgi:ABC-type transport system involved in multi-copper enzyme maturation permease subunit